MGILTSVAGAWVSGLGSWAEMRRGWVFVFNGTWVCFVKKRDDETGPQMDADGRR
jgi:hypothetical protein